MAREGLIIDITVEQQAAINQLKKFANELNRTTDVARIKVLRDEMAKLDAQVKTFADDGADKLNKKVGAANQTLMNFGRVIQDAPFGIMGIANNIDPLINSFQNLSKSTKESGGAFGALKAAISGPAGIAIGVSALTSLLVAYGDELLATDSKVKVLAESQKKFNEEMSKSVGQAKAEQTELRNLVGFITDTTQAVDARKTALTQLKAEYPGFNELQKLDITDAKKLEEVTNKLTDAIMRKARAQAYGNLIAEQEAKIFKIQNEQGFEMADRLSGLDKVAAGAAGAFNMLAGGTMAAGSATFGLNNALASQKAELTQAQQNLALYNKKLKENTTEQLKNKDAQMFGGGGGTKTTPNVAKAVAAKPSLLDKAIGGAREPKTWDTIAAPDLEALDAARQMQELRQQEILDRNALIQLKQIQTEVDAQHTAQQAQAIETMNQYNGIAQMGAAAFSQLANSLLSGEDFGKAFVNMLVKMGIQLAAVVVQAQILAALIKSNPALEGVFATTGQIAKIGGLIGNSISGGNAIIRGQDIVMAQSRSNTTLNRRRGRG